jgi:hypothetical protein
MERMAGVELSLRRSSLGFEELEIKRDESPHSKSGKDLAWT